LRESGDGSNLNMGKAKLTKLSHYLGVFVEPSCHSKRPSKGNSESLNTCGSNANLTEFGNSSGAEKLNEHYPKVMGGFWIEARKD
jgi:hypothetical protein